MWAFFGDVDGAVVCVMITLLEQLVFMKYVGNYCANDDLVTRSQSSSLTFRGPCIVIYSCNKIQRDALFLNFILVKNFTCFGQIYCPSSGVLILYSQQ